jgi:hypothetical protein
LTPTLSPTPAPTLIGGGNKLILNLRDESNNIAGGSLYLYDLQTGETTLLLEEYQCLAISPDGDKLVLTQPDGQNNKVALYTSDTNGSHLILLHENIFNSESVWLPDTDWISFLSYGDNEKIQVFIVHPDGTGLEQLTHSTIGAGKIFSYFDGGVFWEEALVTSLGTWSHGFRRTTIDGSETQTVEEPISKKMPDTVPAYIVNSNFYLDQLFWERGEWSPDGRLYVYFKIVNFIAYKGGDNILMIFNKDTKQVDEWNLNLPEGLEPSGIFWLTNKFP